MHAYLITGGNADTRQQEITKRITELAISAWDSVRLAGEGIAAVRDFQRELSMSPRAGTKKAGIIEHAETLTPQAQNALLKLLEEPPIGTTLFIETENSESLLPTILSRVSVIRLESQTERDEEMEKILEQLLQAPVGKRLQILTKFETSRDEAEKFIDRAIVSARQLLIKKHNSSIPTLIRNLLSARSELSVNVNQKLVLDNVFL